METWKIVLTIVIALLAAWGQWGGIRRSPKAVYLYRVLYLFCPYVLVTVAFMNLFSHGMLSFAVWMVLAAGLFLAFVRKQAPLEQGV